MLHLGLAALLLVVVAWGFRKSPRRAGTVALSLLALAAAASELSLAVRRASVARNWHALATAELEARAARIVEYLRDEGTSALAAIRATGGDADTRALLSSEGALVRTARRPVFLDLMERFPGREAGVTVYDAAGFPRAWSGWSATATMSLAAKPSPDAEIVEIREGNIYTILQVTHPVVATDRQALGWVVYQRPLRVQFPLENRFLRVDDVLRRLEGGAGVRADVAFTLSLREEGEVAGIRPGALKLDVREPSASAAAAIVSAGGEPVGRVTLSGLSRDALITDRLAGLYRARAWLLLATGLLITAWIWLAAADRGTVRPLARVAVVVLARFALSRGAPWTEGGFLGVFDPSVYALNRFGGLARSPGDLALSAAALVLVGRELRSLVAARAEALVGFGRRFPLVAWVPGVAAALLVGSCAGFHWSRTVSVARDANVPLYSGLDPFASAPAAALELALLLGGAAFLLFGDALVRAASALLSRWPTRSGVLAAWALAAFAAAVKIGAAADEASLGGPASSFDSDLVRTVATIAALFAFHRLASAWQRPRAAAIFIVAFLAQAAAFTAIAESTEIRRRGLVELLAQDHVESPSSYRQFLIGSVLEHLSESLAAKEVLAAGAGPEQANLAFVLWGRSPLASVAAGCRVRILDGRGQTVSTFSLGFPPELSAVAHAAGPTGERASVRYRREEVGAVRVDLYTGAAPIASEGRVLGAVEVAMAWFDDLRGTGPALASVFTNLTAPDELLGFVREVPDRIDRYRGETLVYSTDPEGGLGKRVPEFLVQALADTRASGRWVERKIDGKLYDLYCVRERDGEVTVGYLTFGIERMGPLSAAGLFVRTQLVALVLTLFALLVFAALAGLLPAGRAGRFEPPRIGFRERVIGGFLIVALLPTVFLGFAGRKLFVEEQLQEFQRRLEEDLRLSGELLGRRLADAARAAAASREVRECFADPAGFRTLSAPLSGGGVVAVSSDGRVLGASSTADLALVALPGPLAASDTPVEFFRRRGEELYSCALVPVAADAAVGAARGSVMAFQRVDPVLAADLERRVGSAVSFFAGGLLTATSKPELYQSEILSDLTEPTAYLKIELEGARRTLVESRVGSTSFLAAYSPLLDEAGGTVGILSTLAAFRGQGLGVEAGRVLSNIYFVCLAVLAGAVAAAVLLANRLTRPISDLTRGAERIGAGGLGHVIATKAGGEIGALVRSFNSMSRRLAESEARDRERREYIEAIIRNVGSGVISFDARGRIATVNDAAARIVGRAAEELVGQADAAAPEGSGDALGAVLRAARPLLAGERTEVVDEIEVAPAAGEADEQLHTLRLVGTPLADRAGKPQGAVVVFEDLTELIRSKKIKAWAEMARQVAHEIKNPLTPMKLSAQQVLQAWKDQHPKFGEILRESTETIVDRCEALRRIAMEFSDYARMPGRKIRREDLGRLLGEARKLYALDDRSVDFTLEAPEGRVFTRVDKDEVMRLFINLIENSIQAMPAGGNLSVRAWGENGSAHVMIRDTGTGITAENLARIFEPSFSTKTGGAGLGLPICKAIMQDYGGTIDIESRPGDGTTVKLVFPAET